LRGISPNRYKSRVLNTLFHWVVDRTRKFRPMPLAWHPQRRTHMTCAWWWLVECFKALLTFFDPSLVPLRRRCIAARPCQDRTAWSARDRTSPRLCMRLMWAWDSRLGSHQIGAAQGVTRGSQVATRNRRVKQSLPGRPGCVVSPLAATRFDRVSCTPPFAPSARAPHAFAISLLGRTRRNTKAPSS
jgi:hypothetical protein